MTVSDSGLPTRDYPRGHSGMSNRTNQTTRIGDRNMATGRTRYIPARDEIKANRLAVRSRARALSRIEAQECRAEIDAYRVTR